MQKSESITSCRNLNGFNTALYLESEFKADSDSEVWIPISLSDNSNRSLASNTSRLIKGLGAINFQHDVIPKRSSYQDEIKRNQALISSTPIKIYAMQANLNRAESIYSNNESSSTKRSTMSQTSDSYSRVADNKSTLNSTSSIEKETKFNNEEIRSVISKSGLSNLVNKKAKKKNLFREGDWICNECQNMNFSFRDKCNKCANTKIFL